MIKQIEYENKQAIQNDDSIPNKNKVTAEDMNEIKETVNQNADELENCKTEIVRLRNDLQSSQLTGEANGESIDLNDSSAARFRKFGIGGNHKQKTRSGKNILKIPFESGSSNGLTWVVYDDGTILLNGTTTKSTNIIKDGVKINAKEGETVTLSAEGTENIFNLGYKNIESGNNILVIDFNTPTQTKTLTNDNLSKANRLNVYISSGKTFNNQALKIMLEKGSTATKPYEQYGASPSPDFPSEIKTVKDSVEIKVVNNDNTQEQTITMPVQQEMLEGDYISNVEHHEWEKVVLDGTEKLALSGATTDEIFVVALNISGAKDGYGCSNYFVYSSTIKQNSIAVYNNGKNLRFCVNKNEFLNLEAFKAWLKSKYDEGNPVIVYYKLAEPINLELISEQKAVAKQIKETLHTYKNVTHICSDDETSPIVNVEYAKDLNTIISNIQALVLNNASEEVSG